MFVDLQAEFVCRTNGVVTDWKINDTLWNNHDLDLRSDMRKTQDENYNKVLTSSNTSKYNNTEVQCIWFAHFDSSTYVGSNIVTLRIQGIFCSLMSAWIHLFSIGTLSAVGELDVKSNATTITVSWIAPFSLDVTDVDPDIWYSVLIHNVTDSDRPTAINCTDCTNITETCYTFSPDHLSLSHKYNFTVIPFNGAGQGEISHNITGSSKNPADFISCGEVVGIIRF